MNAAVPAIAADLALGVPLDGMQLIEASAGTGKTFTIAGLYVRLLVERELPVRQILVMTYTRAATEELRRRIRERLVLCASLAASPATDPDAPEPSDDAGYEQRWALALLRRARAAGTPADALSRRLRGAAMGMDEAVIITIHGFCQRVLAEHGAFLDGVVPGAELVPSDRDLLDDFAADFWLRAAGDDDPDRLAALQALASTPAELARTLVPLIAFAGSIEPAPCEALPAGADTAAAWQRLVDAWGTDADAAIEMFRTCFDGGHLNGNSFKAGCVEQLRALAARLRGGQRPQPGELARYGGAHVAKSVKKAFPPFPGHAAFAAIDAWLEAERQAEERRAALLPEWLQRAVDEARTWLAARKCALARLSYDDQIGRVFDGLHDGASSPRLAAALRAQFPCALVDEFQDTDARQFAIFEKLYRGHGTLFVIGDPKQAIYGFRGGDVHAYLRAAKLADARHHLDRNFRSAPSLLAATAAVFTARGDDAFVEPGIRFEPVTWGGGAGDGALRIGGDAAPALTVWPLPNGDDGKPLSAKDASAALTRGCALAIARLLAPGAASLGGKPLNPGHIAVLVNSHAEAMAVLDALRAHGIAAVCVRKESIYATREAAELLLLLDALLAPQDLALARGALAGEWLGRTLADFHAMGEDDAAWRGALQELANLRERWFARGILAMLELLAERHAPRLLALAEGERQLGNLLQLGDALQAVARGHAGARALRDWLAQRIRDADRNNEEEQLRLESDAERVQILTLHAA
jgi:exodeoxyribonuclease V beta subunit